MTLTDQDKDCILLPCLARASVCSACTRLRSGGANCCQGTIRECWRITTYQDRLTAHSCHDV